MFQVTSINRAGESYRSRPNMSIEQAFAAARMCYHFKDTNIRIGVSR